MRPDKKLLRMLSLLGQFGFTLIFPAVALVLLARWLDWGALATVAALVVGLLSGLCGSWRLLKGAMGKDEEKNQPVRFDRHE